MVQDPAHDEPVGDRRDQPARPAAVGTSPDVDGEHAPQELGPTEPACSGWAASARCADVSAIRRPAPEGQKPRPLNEKARWRPVKSLVPPRFRVWPRTLQRERPHDRCGRSWGRSWRAWCSHGAEAALRVLSAAKDAFFTGLEAAACQRRARHRMRHSDRRRRTRPRTGCRPGSAGTGRRCAGRWCGRPGRGRR